LSAAAINISMKVNEIASPPNTPEQSRIAALKRAKEQATKSLNVERQRQQIAKAQEKLVSISASANKPV
jgi:hypothetical protein